MLVSARDETGPPRIWFLPFAGVVPLRVTTDISSYDFPAPMADGHSFAAVRGEGSPSITIFSVDDNGSANVVASGLGENFGLAGVRSRSSTWTGQVVRWLDSEHILYVGVANGRPAFFVIPRSGGKAQQLIRGMKVWDPAVSSDRKRLLFLAGETGGEVWVSDIDGTNAGKLTPSPPDQAPSGTTGWTPQFSDGGRFVYYKSRSRLWRVPVGGGKAERVNLEAGAVAADMATISPDGNWLMVRSFGDRQRTHLYPLPAGGPPRIFEAPPSGTPMRFHPSSRAFGFVAWSDDGIPNIWLQNIDGGPPRQITHFDRGDIYAFDWSPDGKWLAVSYGEPKTDVVIVRDFR